MNTHDATLAWYAAVGLGLATPHARPADDPTKAASPLTVLVTNFAEVPPAVLDRAEVEAGGMYHRMGVTTIWLDSTRYSAGPTADSGFTIRLIVQRRLAGPSADGPRAIMAAAPPSKSEREGSIYVYYDRVTDVAALQRADTARLMGIVIAHEIAHHLLHHADHAEEGLMRGVWDAEAIRRGAAGLLWFSKSELQEMRKTLSTCCW